MTDSSYLSGRSDTALIDRIRYSIPLLGVVILFGHLYYAWSNPMPRQQWGIVHFGLLMAMFYLAEIDFTPESRRDHADNAVNIIFLIVSIVTAVYAYTNFFHWLEEVRILQTFTPVDLLIGLLAIVTVIHATWRAYGKVLGLVGVFALFYGYAGPLFPSILNHSGISIEQLIFVNTIAMSGVWGFIMQVGATWVIIFILFAGLVEGYGGMDYLTDLGRSLGSRMQSGVVQVAVVTSFIVGSIMGGSASNVATTGSFTIPLMIDQKVQPRIAAAIEAIASTGGQILPPVMGSAAFLMADIIGISYFDVVVGATLPALLYYIPVVLVVQLSAIRYDWGASDEDEEPSNEQSEPKRTTNENLVEHIVESSPFVISFVILLYVLIILRYDPLSAGMYTIFSLMATALLRDLYVEGLSLNTLKKFLADTVEGSTVGAVNMAPLTAVIGMLGIVVQILTKTGFAQRFAFQVITLGGGTAIIVFILVALVSIVFGMGMPTPAAYVVVAIMAAPALVRFGMEPLVAHLFVFYYALLSTITPPVALSCAVGSGIANADFMDTCWSTLRLGLYAFIVPFVFIYNPEIVVWSGIDTWIAFGQAVLGLSVLAIALAGHNTRLTIGALQRTAFGAIAFGILFLPSVFF